MAFNPEIHQIKLIIIRCGELLHPEEKNITKLYEETSVLLGMPLIPTSTADAGKLPSPAESMKEMGMPHRVCPQCGKETFQIFGLCASCQEAEGGKFKTLFECSECHFKEKSKKPIVVWLREMDWDFGNQSKRSLGIQTITDDGIK